MRFDKIVGFGDSWMWGDELIDPGLRNVADAHPVMIENTQYRESHCFLGLLGKHYNVPTENFGIAGGSMTSSIWCYLWWLENNNNIDNTLVLVANTDPWRQTFYNPNHVSYANDPSWNRYVHASWIQSGSTAYSNDWINMVKAHTVLTSCNSLSKLNYQHTVLFFEGQSHMRSGRVLQFSISNPIVTMPVKSLLHPDSGIMHLVNQSSLRCSGGHPNEQGHEIIRNHLINEIDCAILAQ